MPNVMVRLREYVERPLHFAWPSVYLFQANCEVTTEAAPNVLKFCRILTLQFVELVSPGLMCEFGLVLSQL